MKHMTNNEPTLEPNTAIDSLLAWLSQLEQLAQAARDEGVTEPGDHLYGMLVTPMPDHGAAARLADAFPPDWVLAEVAAKRAIVADYESARQWSENQDCTPAQRAAYRSVAAGLGDAIRHLATVHAGDWCRSCREYHSPPECTGIPDRPNVRPD